MPDYRPYTHELLTAKRATGDVPADAFIQQQFGSEAAKAALRNWLAGLNNNQQLTELPPEYQNVPMLNHAAKLPQWAKPRLMKAGSAFFIRYSETIMTLLGLLSLPYCYTAANGAMVLYLSERMRNDTTRRLYETAAFVWEVMAPNAFTETGAGFSAILKVRLMHAAVRYYTSAGGNWNPDWGVPVNLEDMAGTNLSFSFLVVRGLRKLGYAVNQADQEAFLHLWAVIGYFSGLDKELIPENSKQAQLLDSAISERQFCVSAHGRILTKSLTDHIISVNTSKAAPDDILGLMRYLLGTEVADMLEIKAPELPAYKLGLIKLTNLVKGLKPLNDTHTLYNAAYHRFKQQQPKNKSQTAA